MVEGILPVKLLVSFIENILFPEKTELLLLRFAVLSPAQRFMMIQYNIISYHIIVTILVYGVAKIYIVKCNRKFFPETSRLLKHLPAHHQAGTRGSQHIMDSSVHSIIMNLPVIQKLQLMSRSHAEIRNSRVLNHLRIRIEKLCPHTAHIGQTCLFKHKAHPIRLNDLHIIIQEKQKISSGLFCSEITHFRKIERHWLIEISASFHSCSLRKRRKLLHNRSFVFLAASIIHNKDFVTIRCSGSCENRMNTGKEYFRVIFGWDDDRKEHPFVLLLCLRHILINLFFPFFLCQQKS